MGIGFLWQTGTQPTSLLLLDAMHSIIIDAATHSTLKGKQAVLLESTSDASKFTGGANLVIDMPVQVISTGVAAVEISTEAGQDRSVGPVNVFGPGRIETQGATSPSMSVDLVGGKGKKGDDDDIGNGDKGNAGGTVGLITLNSDQTIPGNSVWELSTTGNSSPGIMINAQGGEGGGGGAGLNNGGGGNTGGTGGGVSVGGPNASNNYGPATLGITTQGQQSPAISVVSTGGNGGEGHSGDGGNGGNGGHGGPGGAISVVLDSSTGSTTHKESPAIVAVSNGGDGGKGGGSPTGTGGNGGVGRGGGAIEVTLTGKNTILTGGSDSDAISAYSIGGQGGKGGSGGWLGPGGNGDVVTLTNTSSVATSGNGAKGLFAQSIGGAGGAGGSSVAIVGIGGNGGAASKGNSVTITNSGDISTGTTAATGPANANDSCETGCSAGIMAQSIGGAGGDGSGVSTLANATVLVNLGGGSGSTGNGGTVEVDHFASEIQTTGVGSVGIFAQSVGGGGGKAATGIVTASHSINLGGTGGGSGAGGSVTVNVSGGSINTGHGATAAAGTVAAHGVVAQSVGGGGGYAGNVKIGAESNFGTDLAMNANGTDTSGNGGDVAVTIAGPVTTWGQSSLGVFAQSVGGGGVKGDGGTPAADALVGSGGGSGNSGTVMVTTSANITAHGKHAHAIFAQGAAGKAGTAGDMTISVNGGKVSALRDGGHGILAQNLGTGSGEISVTVAKGGTVSGGGDATEQGKADGAGIYINPSASSTITNQGTIESSLGSTGTAILFTGLSGVDLQVANSGTITGEICKNGTCSPGSAPAGGATITLDNAETGVGTITLNNAEAGVIVTGNLLDVNALSNRGTIDLGGADRILSTRHQGDFVHHETGKVLLDLDARQNLADQAAITGVADLAGKAVMTVNDAGRPKPRDSVTILTTEGELSDRSPTSLSVQPSVVANYELAFPSRNQVDLSYRLDFASPQILAGINENQRQVTESIQDIFSQGALDATLTSLTSISNLDDYATAMDSLGGELFADTQMTSLYSSTGFGDSLLSCAQRSGDHRFVRQGQCGWMRFEARRLERDDTGDNIGFDEDTFQIAGGAQWDVGNNWHVGGALSYEDRDLDLDHDLGDSDGWQLQGGVVAKKRIEATMLSGSFSLGYTDFDTKRNVFGGARAKGDQDLCLASAQFRAAHTLERGTWYVKPLVDLGIDYVSMDDFREKGAGGQNLRVDSQDDTYVYLQPAVEFGGEHTTEQGTLLRPTLRLGLTQFLTDTDPSVTAAFEGSPASVRTFTSESELDRTYADVTLGVGIFTAEDWVVNVSAIGRFSDNTKTYGGSLKVSIPF